MVRGIGRFDRRVRPADDTDVFPAVNDDDNTGQIPVPAAAADAEVTGVIPSRTPTRAPTPLISNHRTPMLSPQRITRTDWRSYAAKPSG
jgi:hypothetical protein